MTKTVTLEEVMAARTPRGGWTKKQIMEWGIEYPPERGWIKRLTGDNSAAPPKCGSSLEAKRLRRMSRIELEKENVKLREALRLIAEHPVEQSGQWEVGAREMLKLARAALGGDS